MHVILRKSLKISSWCQLAECAQCDSIVLSMCSLWTISYICNRRLTFSNISFNSEIIHCTLILILHEKILLLKYLKRQAHVLNIHVYMLTDFFLLLLIKKSMHFIFETSSKSFLYKTNIYHRHLLLFLSINTVVLWFIIYCNIFHSCISVNYYLSMYIVGYYLYHQFLIVQVYITKLIKALAFCRPCNLHIW